MPVLGNLKIVVEQLSLYSLDLAKSSQQITNSSPPPRIIEDISVNYLSPLVLRKELENMLNREGDQFLNDPKFIERHPIVYWNLLWYFERIAVKSHIPGLLLHFYTHSNQHKSWIHSDFKNVFVQCHWDNNKLYDSSDSLLYMQWRNPKRSSSSNLVKALVLDDRILSNHSLIEKIINGVQKNDLYKPIVCLLEDRVKFKNTKNDTKKYHSIYRDILYLTLVSLGQDNIDLTAFDREYRKAFEKLPASKYKSVIEKSDQIPSSQTIICRKFFKELIL